MGKFVAGLLAGVILGQISVAAAALVVGDDGYLTEWTVVKDGEDICSGPYVWQATHEIECD